MAAWESGCPPFVTSRSITSLFVLISVILGFLYSTALGQNWEAVMGFLNAQAFNRTDPLYGRDIGYFVFKLPFYRLLNGAAMGIVAETLLVVLVIYVLSRSISFAGRRFQAAGALSITSQLWPLASSSLRPGTIGSSSMSSSIPRGRVLRGRLRGCTCSGAGP